MKKLRFLAMLAAAGAALTLVACSSEEVAEQTSFSTLTGNFALNEQTACYVVNTAEEATASNALLSSMYPQVAAGSPVDYVIDARLKLMRDYTYTYTYSVELRNGGWSDAAARMDVEFGGVFTFGRSIFDASEYTVELSDPVSGTISVTGADMYSFMSGNGLNKWTIHETPDYTADLTYLFGSGYGANEFCCGRTVTVDTSEKTLADELFFEDILDFVCVYNTYQ